MVIITLFKAAIATSIVAGAASSSTALQNQAIAQQENEAIYGIQETAMSTAAPVAHPVICLMLWDLRSRKG
jgi:hypothetical protein